MPVSIYPSIRSSIHPLIQQKLNEEKIMNAYQKGNVVIESMYSWSEYKYIKEKFGDAFKVIAVVVDKEVRKDRIANRDTRALDSAEVDLRDLTEIENIEKAGPIAIADYYILNDGDKDNLVKKLDELYSRI